MTQGKHFVFLGKKGLLDCLELSTTNHYECIPEIVVPATLIIHGER